jgi:hypothetical protein
MPKYAIYCDRPSVTAALLSDTLGITRLRDTDPGTHFKRMLKIRGEEWVIINYGTSYYPWWDLGVNWVNPPRAVATALSKIKTAQACEMAQVPHVKVTTDIDKANQWLAKGFRVLTRRDGLSQGRGIQEGVIEQPDVFYSRVFPKTHEFRVHVVGGKAIDFVEKKAPFNQEEIRVDRLIRNHQNGWVFAHSNLAVTEEDRVSLENLAIRAIKALELNFGAVDILACLNKESPRRVSNAVICEVNSAPGLSSPMTYMKYVEYFQTEVMSNANG